MITRSLIEIDRDKCTGCGLCTTACAEGALELDAQGKAILVRDIYCDGLGACLNVCPADALHIVQKECQSYSAQETFHHVKTIRGELATKHVHGAESLIEAEKPLACGCLGSSAREISRNVVSAVSHQEETGCSVSELTQWPIQLHLISPVAPYFNECDLLIAADCTAFSLGAFHPTLLKGKKLVIACPKLDKTKPYVDKLAQLISHNTIYSITTAIMSVPCCGGLYTLVKTAVEKSGKNSAVKKIVIDVEGKINAS